VEILVRIDIALNSNTRYHRDTSWKLKHGFYAAILGEFCLWG
jgi:hypothetical protein